MSGISVISELAIGMPALFRASTTFMKLGGVGDDLELVAVLRSCPRRPLRAPAPSACPRSTFEASTRMWPLRWKLRMTLPLPREVGRRGA